MGIWDHLKKKVEDKVDEIRHDPRFQQSFQDAERVWQEVEREVELIRRQLRESKEPIIDDTYELKQKLDAYRKSKRS